MNLDEIQMRLDQGLEPVCPDCEYFEENGDCLIIICDNPFVGPMHGEMEDHVDMIELFYNKNRGNLNEEKTIE